MSGAAALREALATPAKAPWLAVHLPAPVRPAARLLALEGGTSFVCSPPGELSCATWGVAWQADAAALASFESLRHAASDVLEHLEERSVVPGAPPPRAFAALPFGPRRAGAIALQNGVALVPRWRYATDDRSAWLTLCLRADEVASADALEDEWRRVGAALDSEEREGALPECLRVEAEDPARFESSVALATEAIRADKLAKVVLARRTRVELASPPSLQTVLRRLAEEAGWGASMAVRSEDGAFLAVTPERLVRRSGRRVESEALAGTAELHTAAHELLPASRKDALEHGWVVRDIASLLAPLCSRLDVPERPGQRVLRHVAHLLTPLAGELRDPVHVLTLAAALHPTPAVGGVPRQRALEWIDALEPSPRGLYAGPIGWFDGSGDGDFWVALRGGLVEGRVATAFAGAGIVRDSQPAEELRETEVKQRAFLRAVGALR